MTIEILTTISETDPLVGSVVSLADQNKEELGFLPYSAYEDLAIRRQLWIAVHRGTRRIAGYLAFGASNYTLRIHQLYVVAETRGQAVGTELINTLKQYARQNRFQVLAARVASDLAANRFWEGQGFLIVRQVPGGRSSGRTINVRVHELSRASLLSPDDEPDSDWLQPSQTEPILSAPSYVLDLNVLFDVVHDRLDADFARRLFSASFSGDARLCVSSEFAAELRRRTTHGEADPVLRLAEALPTLPELVQTQMLELCGQLRALIFPRRDPARRGAENDESDLRHLAACIHHRVRGFVTRERAVLRAGSALRDKYGLVVLAPSDLVSPLMPGRALEDVTLAAPAIIDSGFVTKVYNESDRSEVTILLQKLSVPTWIAGSALECGTSTKPRTRLCVRSNRSLVAFASWNVVTTPDGLQCGHFCHDEDRPGAQLVVDHLLGCFLSAVPMGQLTKCEINCPPSQSLLRNTAQIFGFRAEGGQDSRMLCLRKFAFRGCVSPGTWPTFRLSVERLIGTTLPDECPTFKDSMGTGFILSRPGQSFFRTIDLFSLETALSPLLVLTPFRRAFIVPIRDKLASVLLPSVSVQQSLFSPEAAVRLERAYFGRSGALVQLQRGDIVVFYVSGADGGRAEAVGMARVTSRGSDSPVRLQLDLLRQGVLDQDDLNSMIGAEGSIGYFTFDSFLRFPNPPTYRRLREINCVGGANLVTTQHISYDRLLALLTSAGL
jgi:GNAT superfamily N-acetyltransferase